ncbi:MAG: hypothetical protein LZF60_120117 [Nitrospira sp.]|nr:MAG: hypothetical protein LZF60_120117 [Nitrospira sp.]
MYRIRRRHPQRMKRKSRYLEATEMSRVQFSIRGRALRGDMKNQQTEVTTALFSYPIRYVGGIRCDTSAAHAGHIVALPLLARK